MRRPQKTYPVFKCFVSISMPPLNFSLYEFDCLKCPYELYQLAMPTCDFKLFLPPSLCSWRVLAYPKLLCLPIQEMLAWNITSSGGLAESGAAGTLFVQRRHEIWSVMPRVALLTMPCVAYVECFYDWFPMAQEIWQWGSCGNLCSHLPHQFFKLCTV